MRVCLSTFESKPFVSLRLWQSGEGGLFPTRTGGSIRIHEIDDVIAALQQAKVILAEEGGGANHAAAGRNCGSPSPAQDDKPRFVDKRPRRQHQIDPAALSSPEGYSPGFQEF